jgi:hypothetical protein
MKAFRIGQIQYVDVLLAAHHIDLARHSQRNDQHGDGQIDQEAEKGFVHLINFFESDFVEHRFDGCFLYPAPCLVAGWCGFSDILEAGSRRRQARASSTMFEALFAVEFERLDPQTFVSTM